MASLAERNVTGPLPDGQRSNDVFVVVFIILMLLFVVSCASPFQTYSNG